MSDSQLADICGGLTPLEGEDKEKDEEEDETDEEEELPSDRVKELIARMDKQIMDSLRDADPDVDEEDETSEESDDQLSFDRRLDLIMDITRIISKRQKEAAEKLQGMLAHYRKLWKLMGVPDDSPLTKETTAVLQLQAQLVAEVNVTKAEKCATELLQSVQRMAALVASGELARINAEVHEKLQRMRNEEG